MQNMQTLEIQLVKKLDEDDKLVERLEKTAVTFFLRLPEARSVALLRVHPEIHREHRPRDA